MQNQCLFDMVEVNTRMLDFKPPITTSFVVNFSRSGELLAAISKQYLYVWEISTGRRISKVKVIADPAYIDFSPDGIQVVVKNTSGDIAIYDVASAAVIRHLNTKAEGEGCQIYFTPDCESVVDVSWQGKLTVRRKNTLEKINSLVYKNCQASVLSY